MNRLFRNSLRILALLTPVLLFAPVQAQESQEDDDIDAFMEKVLERRITNWEDLYRYTVRDREVVEVVGPGGERIEGQVGEYTWYVRDGFMIRSPDTMNGARVGDAEREEAEQRFLDRLKRRAEKAAAREEEAGDDADPTGAEREHFLGFPYEPGNYYLVGFEEFEGMEVARIEYYPEELFEDDEDEEAERWTRRFQKTSRITLWVLAEEHQVVKVEYDNIGLEFLPFRWLLQVEDVTAQLVMHKPFPDLEVWLPREISFAGTVGIATGSYEMRYSLAYHDYKEAEVGARVQFRLPGVERQRD